MAYTTRNIIVGAAAVFISAKDSIDGGTDWYPSSGDTRVGIKLPNLTAGTSAVAALETEAAKPAGTRLWKAAGYTTEGVEFSYEPDFGEVQVDQMLDVAKMFKQGMRASVNTTFAEATLENLIIAWGQAEATLTGTDTTDKVAVISAGALGEEPVERSLAFVGGAPRNGSGSKRERVYHLRRALQVEASNHSLSRNDATTIPVSFRLLPEALGTSGADYGTVTDRTIT